MSSKAAREDIDDRYLSEVFLTADNLPTGDAVPGYQNENKYLESSVREEPLESEFQELTSGI